MKTQRTTSLVTPAQTQAIASKARNLTVSTGKLIRRAVENMRLVRVETMTEIANSRSGRQAMRLT